MSIVEEFNKLLDVIEAWLDTVDEEVDGFQMEILPEDIFSDKDIAMNVTIWYNRYYEGHPLHDDGCATESFQYYISDYEKAEAIKNLFNRTFSLGKQYWVYNPQTGKYDIPKNHI